MLNLDLLQPATEQSSTAADHQDFIYGLVAPENTSCLKQDIEGTEGQCSLCALLEG